MKKLQVLTVLVVCLLTSCAYMAPRTKGLTFEEAIPLLDTPAKINAWMCGNLGWFRGSAWRPPMYTYEGREGSCIHWANFAAYLLVRLGYEEVEVIWAEHFAAGPSGGHAVCAYKNKKTGKWWVIGDARGRLGGPVNFSGSAGPFRTLKQVAEYATGRYGLSQFSTKKYKRFHLYKLMDIEPPEVKLN